MNSRLGSGRQYNNRQYNYTRERGIAINMEGGRNSRHWQTESHPAGGNDPGYHLTPRDVLARDIADLRRIYQGADLYNQSVREQLQQIIVLNRQHWPGLFD
jgi:hypothetical protein